MSRSNKGFERSVADSIIHLSNHRLEHKPRIIESDDVDFFIWRPFVKHGVQIDEIELKGQQMVDIHYEFGTKNIETAFNVADQVALGDLDRVFRRCPEGSFGVLRAELPHPLAGQLWYAYFARIESKSCLLLISADPDLSEAIRRATRWVRNCPKREDHGEPVLIDLSGNVLTNGESDEQGK